MKLMKSLSVKMKLLQAIKPHRTSIKLMNLDKKHKILATASLDNSVYVYRAKSKEGIFQMEPIGYFEMNENVVNLVFKRDKTNIILLVALECHQIILINLNKLPTVTTESLIMKISDYPNYSLNLRPQLPADEEMKLINASFAENPDLETLLVVYSSTRKTIILELELEKDCLSEVERATINQLPDPPGQSNISVIRYEPWVN